MAISENDPSVFFARPLSAVLLVVAAVILLGPRLLRRAGAAAGEAG
jgi:TctA family transporter